VAIDESLYEAAIMDGAGKMRQIFSITIPQLSPVIISIFLMLVGRIFYADFGLHFQVPNNSGALYPVTDVLDTYVYRSLRQMGNISMASAAGFYQAVVGMVIVVIANKTVKRIDESKSLF
jgi:putative aldouronate transport system permease protein